MVSKKVTSLSLSARRAGMQWQSNCTTYRLLYPPTPQVRPHCCQGATRLQRPQAVLQAAHRHVALRQRCAQLPRPLLQGRHAVIQQAALRGGGLQALSQRPRLLLPLQVGAGREP